MEYIVKGGFPRIQVKINKIEEKHEQGFGNNKISLKNIMKNKSSNTMSIGPNNKSNFIKILDGGSNKTINGVPIDIL